MNYTEFLAQKRFSNPMTGHEPGPLSPVLFDFQKAIVEWAVRRGRASIFADCGLGKTLMQLEWAREVVEKTGGDVLILAPLAVSLQTTREAKNMLGLDVNICGSDGHTAPGINITNYEKLHHFDPTLFSGVVLDESSIIKHHTSKTRDLLIGSFGETPYRLACTATPSPNDYMELGNHAEFMGVMSRTEMLSMFFIHDGGDTSKWRLKGHAQDEFWKWLCTWSVMVRKPSDLGFQDNGFELPPVNYHSHVVENDMPTNGLLFAMPANTMQERRKARQESLDRRCKRAAELANSDDKPWVVWCDLNSESELLKRSIPDAVEVKGSDDHRHKEDAMLGFADGKYRVMVSKPSIAGFGMNWQHCNNMAFVGLSDSFESYYQATRRCWRFGQKNPVNVHVITSRLEGAVVENIKRKERDAMVMADNMVQHMSDISKTEIKGLRREKTEYKANVPIKLPSFLEAA